MGAACSTSTITFDTGAHDGNGAMSANPDSFAGVLLITPHDNSTDNLTKTTHEFQIGYCDGDQNYQEISDNVSF